MILQPAIPVVFDILPKSPVVVTCAENDMIMFVGLRFGTCAATLGANDLPYD